MSSASDKRPVELYLHVPFCLSKCAYCDFYSVTGASRRIEPYVDAALASVRAWAKRGVLEDVPTLYLGGGTPTLLGAHLRPLIEGVRNTVGLREDAEITVEANPETTDAAVIADMRTAGVTRVSLGVQSFEDDVLQALGRAHDAARAEEAAKTLVAAGFDVSLDMICGAPMQTVNGWLGSLGTISRSGVGHVSIYPLTLEEGTPLAEVVASGALELPMEEGLPLLDYLTQAHLAHVGIDRYEIANYARAGKESRHNIGYWTGVPYIGIGPSAHSMLDAETFARIARAESWGVDVPEEAARARFWVASDLEAFVRDPSGSPSGHEFLSSAEVLREDVMLGLRMLRGVSEESVAEAGLEEALGEMEDRQRVERVDGRWRLTEGGLMFANEVFGRVWCE